MLLRARPAAACKLNSRLLDRFLILGDMVQEQAGHLENPDGVERAALVTGRVAAKPRALSHVFHSIARDRACHKYTPNDWLPAFHAGFFHMEKLLDWLISAGPVRNEMVISLIPKIT